MAKERDPKKSRHGEDPAVQRLQEKLNDSLKQGNKEQAATNEILQSRLDYYEKLLDRAQNLTEEEKAHLEKIRKLIDTLEDQAELYKELEEFNKKQTKHSEAERRRREQELKDLKEKDKLLTLEDALYSSISWQVRDLLDLTKMTLPVYNSNRRVLEDIATTFRDHLKSQTANVALSQIILDRAEKLSRFPQYEPIQDLQSLSQDLDTVVGKVHFGGLSDKAKEGLQDIEQGANTAFSRIQAQAAVTGVAIGEHLKKGGAFSEDKELAGLAGKLQQAYQEYANATDETSRQRALENIETETKALEKKIAQQEKEFKTQENFLDETVAAKKAASIAEGKRLVDNAKALQLDNKHLTTTLLLGRAYQTNHKALLAGKAAIDGAVGSLEKMISILPPGLQSFLGMDRAMQMVKDTGEKAMAEFTASIARGEGGVRGLAAATRVFGKTLWAALGPIGLIAIALGGVVLLVKGIVDLVKHYQERWKEISKETGLSLSQAKQLHKQTLAMVNSSENKLLVEKDIIELQAAYIKQNGVALDLSKKQNRELINSLGETASLFGYTNEEAMQLHTILRNAGMNDKVAANMQKTAALAAEAAGIAPSIITKDLIEGADTVATYYSRYPKQAVAAAIQTRKLGMSLKQAGAIADKMLDIDSFMTDMFELSAMTRGGIDLSKAFDLRMSGADPAEVAAATLDAVGTLSDFNKQDEFVKRKLADTLGMTTSELQNSLRLREMGLGQDAKAQKAMEALLATGEDLSSISKEQIENKKKELETGKQFDAQMSKLGTILQEALLPLMEALNGSMGAIVGVVKFFGELLKGMVKPLTWISQLFGSTQHSADNLAGSAGEVADKVEDTWTFAKGLGVALSAAAAIWIGGKVGSAIKNTFKTAKGAAESMKDTVKSGYDAVSEGAKSIREKGIKGAATELRDKIKDKITGKSSTTTPETPGTGVDSSQQIENLIKVSKKVDGKAGTELQKFLTNIADGLLKMGQGGVQQGVESTATAGNGFDALGKSASSIKKILAIDSEKLKKALTDIAEGLTKLAEGKTKSGALSLVVASLGFAAMNVGAGGAKKLTEIDGDKLKSTLQGMAEGLTSMGTGRVAVGSLALVVASLGFAAMMVGYLGIKLIEKIDGAKIQESMYGIAYGLEAFGTGKVLAGSLALVLASLGFIAMIPGAIGMVALGLAAPLAAAGLGVLTPALVAFGTAMMSGVGLLGLALFLGTALALAAALRIAAPGIQAFGVIIQAFGTVVQGIGMAIATIITAIGNSISLLGNVNAANILVLGPALVSLAAGLTALTAGQVIKGIADFFTASPEELLNELADVNANNIMTLANAVVVLAGALDKLNAFDSDKLAATIGQLRKLDNIDAIAKIVTASMPSAAETRQNKIVVPGAPPPTETGQNRTIGGGSTAGPMDARTAALEQYNQAQPTTGGNAKLEALMSELINQFKMYANRPNNIVIGNKALNEIATEMRIRNNNIR